MFVFTVSHILQELAIYSGSIVRRDEFAFMSQKSVFPKLYSGVFASKNMSSRQPTISRIQFLEESSSLMGA